VVSQLRREVSAKIQEARIRQHQMEKLDATGLDATFGDNDINFNLQHKNFDVNMGKLKESAVQRIFRAWVKDWEEDARRKNDCVLEALLLQKYNSLVFHDPDFGNDFCIWHQTWSIVRGEEMDGSCLEYVRKME
jgi:hypothetical protein